MHKFDLNGNYRAEGDETAETRIGEVHHVQRNKIGSGSTSTPIARYFVWRPNYIEGFKPHWRIDFFARKHKLSGDSKMLAKLLTDKLREIGLCELPVWVSWHESAEIGGEKLGDLWEED